jgi:hypothetical protein
MTIPLLCTPSCATVAAVFVLVSFWITHEMFWTSHIHLFLCLTFGIVLDSGSLQRMLKYAGPLIHETYHAFIQHSSKTITPAALTPFTQRL